MGSQLINRMQVNKLHDSLLIAVGLITLIPGSICHQPWGPGNPDFDASCFQLCTGPALLSVPVDDYVDPVIHGPYDYSDDTGHNFGPLSVGSPAFTDLRGSLLNPSRSYHDISYYDTFSDSWLTGDNVAPFSETSDDQEFWDA